MLVPESSVIAPVASISSVLVVPATFITESSAEFIVNAADALRSIIAASTLSSVEAFTSTVGAVISKVVPAFTSKWPFADATMFSPPAASWKDNLLSFANNSSSAAWPHWR